MEISLNICCVKRTIWASLVIQWLIIRLAMQGTLLPSRVQEDPTGLRSAEPMRHNSWTCPLDPSSCNCWAHTSQLLKLMCPRDCTPQQERLPQWEACTLQLEKAHPELQRPSTAKNIYFFFFKREHHVSEAIYWTWSSFDLMAVEVQKHMAIMIRTIVSFGDHEKAPPLTHTYFCVQAVFIMFSCLKHWVSGQG